MSKPDEIKEQPWFEWMEDALRAMYEDSPTSIMLAARLKSGDTMTAYYNAGPEDIAAMLSHVNGDSIIHIIEVNATYIKDILDKADEDEEEETE